MQTEEEKTEAEVAAAKRRALRASLERERDGYKTRGLSDRAAQVEEQLKRLGDDRDGEPVTDGEASDSAEERTPNAPVEQAVESKPRSTAGRSRGK